MKRQIFLGLYITLFGSGFCGGKNDFLGTPKLKDDVERLYEDFWAWRLRDMPQFATAVGVHIYDHLLDDMSEAAYQSRYDKCVEFLQRAKILEPSITDRENLINTRVITHVLESYIDSYHFKAFYLPINIYEGVHKYAEKLFPMMPRNSLNEYDKILSRLQLLPIQIDQIIDLMKSGVKFGVTYNNVSMKNMDKYLGEYVVETPAESPFYVLFGSGYPSTFTQDQITIVQEKAKLIITDMVAPSFEKLRIYVTSEYQTRSAIAVTAVYQGKAFYDRLIFAHTSTNMTPKEIQETGFREVARIEGEMQKVILEMGYGNMSTKDFSNMIREEPSNYFNTSDELLDSYNHIVHKVIRPRLSLIFKDVSSLKLEVQGDPSPIKAGASYRRGSKDRSRNGVFFFSSYNPKSQAKYNMLSLALHEGNPGHHLQSAYNIESPNFPDFRRNQDYRYLGGFPSQFPIFTDYNEGWALYSEKLGFDMDLYSDSLDRYGHYSSEIFRACRLVVDTGIHALGWTKEEAIQYMLNHTANSELKIELDVNRYITWPGQALAYKIGELRISELRAKAETELGVLFNIKDFHEVVLSSMGPMEIVEEEVNKYISGALKDTVTRLSEDYWQWKLQDLPQFATTRRIHSYDYLLDDMSEDAYEDRYEKCSEFLQRVYNLESTLSEKGDIINIRILKQELKTYLDSYYLKGFYLPINYNDGVHIDLVPVFDKMLRDTLEDYEKIISRLEYIPSQFDQIIDLMKAGVASEITSHNRSMKNLDTLLGNFIVENATDSQFYKYFVDDYPSTFSQEEIRNIQEEAQLAIIRGVVPAFEKLRAYIVDEYKTRPQISISSIFQGKQFYDQAIFYHTSTNSTAQQIHDIGFSEVARIEREMTKIIEEMGFGNMTPKEFSNRIRDDPSNYYNTTDELLDSYKYIVHELVPSKLQPLFTNVTSIELKVKGISFSGGPKAYYRIGYLDGSLFGTFYFNSHSLKLQPKYTTLTLALHEGIPGHHLQISYIIESTKFPNFRKFHDRRSLGSAPSKFLSYSYFKEGWALYAEDLGFEMDLYGDLLDRYGHFSEEIFRACRLVVDTGIHALGWTRDKAIQFMLDHTASSEDDIQNEVDRYITWPGQALSYKMGQLKISELRLRAETNLGALFNIKEFHDVILRSFGPLNIVEEEVDTYIACVQKNEP